MRVSYNSPVVLTFALLSLAVLGLGQSHPELVSAYFTSCGHWPTDVSEWASMFLYVLGHASANHFTGNMVLFLLLGPVLEEKYGSWRLIGMIAITAIATSGVSAHFQSQRMIGASGVVFMMIILASITNVEIGTIPLTMILVSAIYIGREVTLITHADNVSRFGHIFGGAIGGFLGLVLGPVQKSPVQK